MATKQTPKMPSTRIAQKRQRTRREILDAARTLLLRGGADAVTLASVAGELGLTKPALYHYFPSKEALIRSLVVTLLDEEIETLIAAIEAEKADDRVLGTMIRAFYAHYIDRLDAFRTVYCQSQLIARDTEIFDAAVLREEINPRTRHLFDVLEARLSGNSRRKAERARHRQLAFSAWLGALGLMTMLGVAAAASDPLVYGDEQLLKTLSDVFDQRARDAAG